MTRRCCVSLLCLRQVNLALGGPLLLRGADLVVEIGERVCVLGRNGTGKSTLLALVAGDIAADAGVVERRQGLRIGVLPQAVPVAALASGHRLDGRTTATPVRIIDVVAGGLGADGGLLAEYEDATARVVAGEDGALATLGRVQEALEARGAWDLHVRVETTLTRLGLDGMVEFESLSGGQRRRVLLARALVGEPELLLLDEPTNHLDLETIGWLESTLLERGGALLFVSHDRAFIDRVATRIVELDRARLLSFPGNYSVYAERKSRMLADEASVNAEFDRRLAEEEVWIRKGIEARRTRNEGRVRALLAMREERKLRRERDGSVRAMAQQAERSGKLVFEVEEVAFDWPDGSHVLHGLTTVISRADRVGILGRNGAGKTTLIRLLLGDLQPTTGSVRAGTRLQVAYFDQLRAGLDESASVRDNVAGGSDEITVNGAKRHVVTYLRDFLFDGERARTPVSRLSGGERSRLLLARLFATPSNVLVLDEPTNDLDLDTLEVLEDLVGEYQGTVLLVSHDRALLDAVATSVLVVEEGGRVSEYVGGYSDWLRQRPVPAAPVSRATVGGRQVGSQSGERSGGRNAPAPTAAPVRATRLGYKDQRELDALPARIEALEQAQAELHARLADPALYREAAAAAADLRQRLVALERELKAAYARWESLEERRA